MFIIGHSKKVYILCFFILMMYLFKEKGRFFKSGQVSIFVIVAIVLVGSLLAFFAFKGYFSFSEVPSELRPVYDYYSECIKEELEIAVDVSGTQGGRIFIDDYVPGSEYAPFSSEMNFLGFPVPYWYYVAGNGLIKENVPTKNEIEDDIEEYVRLNAVNCDFSQFEEAGIEVDFGEVESVNVKVNENNIEMSVNSDLSAVSGEIASSKSLHEVVLDSRMGKFYEIARRIYDKEKKESFFENYAVDVLRLYAPVDGTEISCSPKVWKTNEVFDDVKNGLENNFASLKFDGNYYQLDKEENKYFVIDESSDESVNVIYNKNWPTKIDISGEGASDSLIIAESVGNQEGLSMMGFCYVPYHYVYDLSFPVVVQVYNNEELFQFPVVVVVDNNLPREGIYSEINEAEDFDLCEFKNKEISVNIYDRNLQNIDANVSYQCFNQNCYLGESKNGKLNGLAPSCLNGFVVSRVEGYKDNRILFSTNKDISLDVIMDREHEVVVDVEIDGRNVAENVIVNFVNEEGKTYSAILPEVEKVRLSEGVYEIRLYVYGNSSIVIPESTRTECTEIPESGLGGIFGSTKERCFDIVIPATKIENAIIGGGKSNDYFLEDDLKNGKILLKAGGLPRPNSIEELQSNYALFEAQSVEAIFNEA